MSSNDWKSRNGKVPSIGKAAVTVKPGYKMTEVGVIPEVWDVKRFSEIGELTKGKGLLKEEIKRSGSIPAIPYTALYTDFSEVLDYSLIKWFVDDETKTVIVQEPCVLFASSSNMEANTGKASAIVGTAPVAIGREVIIFKTSADCQFISYLLSTTIYRRKTLTLARGTTIKHVYPATFQAYQVAHPPLPEQRAIAEALSDVDALLGALDRLIAKKRDLKQAAMQQLLTGQTRLPGFHGEWEVTRLGEIADVKTGPFGSSLHESDYVRDGTPIITVEHLGEFGVEHFNLPLVSDSDRQRLRAYALEIGDIVFSRVGSVDRNALIRPAEEGWLFSGRLLRVRPYKQRVIAPFLSYQFHGETFIAAVREVAVGQTMACLNTQILKGIAVTLPTLPEQTAIASVLSDMDAELAALEQRREKTRALKQGMMQELLTGRTRLV